MGRITAYDQDGYMMADFDKGEYDLTHGWIGTEMERLRIENGKLRELCRDIWKSAYIDAHHGARFADRMRELGIEVGD